MLGLWMPTRARVGIDGPLSFLVGGVAGPLILAFWLALLLGVLIVLGLASFALDRFRAWRAKGPPDA